MVTSRPRHQRARERISELEGRADAFVTYFKERVYATFTGLAIVLVVATADDHESVHALLALLLGVVGIVAAGFVSDIIAHLAVHREFPRSADLRILARIAGGALGTVVTPGILLALAWFGVISIEGALRASAIVYIVTLAVVGWLAVRRSHLVWWKQLIVLGMLVALGLVVVLLQTLAHAV